jgi:flagellar hook-length control protein FliK
VAFDVRPASASSSSAGTKSSSPKSSSTDLFAQNLAAAKQSSTSKPKSNSDSEASNGKSSSATAADKSSAAGKPSAAGSTQGSAANAAAAHSARDGSTTGHAAAANSANGNSATNSVSKGRATTKTSAAQIAAAKGPGNGIDDPSADTANQSGLSLLQLLAQSLQGDSAAPATDSAVTAATDKPADGSGATGNDPNAAALAAFTQALAAALGASNATQQGIVSNTAAGAAGGGAAGGGTAGVTGATRSSNGASMQDLAALLAQTVAADAKGKSDANAPQLNVDPTKGTASDTSTANTAAAGPNSLAHLGVASHFSLQHSPADTSVGVLESPVGSPAWHDELGSQLTWMTQNGLETGSLRVSPEHLGPVEVKISVQNGAASVWFGATHPDTRAALEQALPQLRAMFASQGMTLTDSGVSRESPRNQTKSQAPQSVSAVSAIGSADVSTSAAVRMSLGLVDTYA